MKTQLILLCVVAAAFCTPIMGPYSSVFKGWTKKQNYVVSKDNPCCSVGYNTEPLGLEGGEGIKYASTRFKKLGKQLYKITRVVNKSDGSLWCIIYSRVEKGNIIFDRVCVYTSDECQGCQKVVEQLIATWELNQ